MDHPNRPEGGEIFYKRGEEDKLPGRGELKGLENGPSAWRIVIFWLSGWGRRGREHFPAAAGTHAAAATCLPYLFENF